MCWKEFKPFHFEHRNNCFWDNDKRISPESDGSLDFLPDGVMKLTRRDLEGRYEVELRRDGPKKPSIPKKYEPVHRVLRVYCEAKVDKGEHALRFVLKDINSGKWADAKPRKVSSTEWTPLEVYLRALSTVDILFRIDDEKPTTAPSSVYIRDLTIAEDLS